MIFFDTEVFKYDHMFVFVDTDTGKYTNIVNDDEWVKEFYAEFKNELYAGYNARSYDAYMYKAALLGFDLYDLNEFIISKRQKGWQYSGAFRDIKLACFDVMTSRTSLKALEGMMGANIKETSVPFDIDRPLNDREIAETIEYCTYDVEQTIEVFLRRLEEFEAHRQLIKIFRLPFQSYSKTKAQVVSQICGGMGQKFKDDPFNFPIVPGLELTKYKYVLDWYKSPENHDYEKSLDTVVADVPHTFAWGGLHGAIPNAMVEGYLLNADVTAYYPSIQLAYKFGYRNMGRAENFEQIHNENLRHKMEGNKKARLPYKIADNSISGQLKDKYSKLYDPMMNNAVCVNGQLMLLMLIEMVEQYVQVLQSNTDGVLMKLHSKKDHDKIAEIVHDWESKTKMVMELEAYNRLYQKDVNNYLLIAENGKYKTTGAYVKQTSDLDNDLAIVNKAVIDYFVHGIEPEATINSCHRLIDFQKISKIGAPYAYGMYGDERIKERVIRTFASRARGDKGAFKVKINDEGEHRPAKIENTAPRCRIVNENVVDVPVPIWLDRTWYIEMANKRIKDFMGVSD